MARLTSKQYWDAVYSRREGLKPISIKGFHNRCKYLIYKIKKRFIATNEDILEIGGGGSAWLAFLSEAYPGSRFHAVDYSKEGEKVIRDYIEKNKARNIEVYREDFWAPDTRRIGAFDFVYSHGVVEHFSDLSEVLRAHARYLSDEGVMLTIIPNMSGALGLLTRIIDKDVYNIHVPHDKKSFTASHEKAGLEIVEASYLCSNNFGVLSSCVDKTSGPKYWLYVLLYSLSLGIWLFESRVVSFPATRVFSPYIYAVSKKKTGSG